MFIFQAFSRGCLDAWKFLTSFARVLFYIKLYETVSDCGVNIICNTISVTNESLGLASIANSYCTCGEIFYLFVIFLRT